jgi:nitrate reductase gamma subunit
MSGRLPMNARALRVLLALAVAALTLLSANPASADTAEAKKIFTTRCMACHTFGKGVKVGPDLKGVNDRRKRDWLIKFVRGSSAVIASGDPTAAALFEEFKQQRMPDWVDLSADQVNGIMDWLAMNGPDQQDIDARSADSATLAEIELGRQLFHGVKPMALGGIACASCHSVHDAAGTSGGVLASDLTATYADYQDAGMKVFLKHPCVLRFPESTLPAFLSADEAFYINAYLRDITLANQPAGAQKPEGSKPGPAMVAKTVDSGGASPPPPGAPAAAANQPANAGKHVVWAPKAFGAQLRLVRSAALPSELLFQVFPYVALLLLVVGLGIRHALARRRPEAIRPAADAAWQLFRGSFAWRAGLGITALLHLGFVLVPGSIRAWDGAPLRLYLLEATGLVFGVVALVGLVQVMVRHISTSLAEHHPRVFEVGDYVLLTVMCVAVVSGLASAVVYRWGSAWAIGTVTPYLRSLAAGEPATGLVEQMPFLVRLHVFSWFALIAVVPFTSFASIFIGWGDRLAVLAGHPITFAARAGQRVAAEISPAHWLWPEEDHPGDGGHTHEPS